MAGHASPRHGAEAQSPTRLCGRARRCATPSLDTMGLAALMELSTSPRKGPTAGLCKRWRLKPGKSTAVTHFDSNCCKQSCAYRRQRNSADLNARLGA